ncbi:MAG: type II toxin-antitoxin system RelE/ParE family toxin [Salinivirgaceae bacterium]
MGNTKEKAPKTYTLRVAKNALQNIDDITGYIAYIKHQPLNAIRVGDKIFETINRIEQNPLAFRVCEKIPTKTKIYRQAVCMSWLIIYRIKASEIVVLGIIYGSRRVSKVRKLRKVN